MEQNFLELERLERTAEKIRLQYLYVEVALTLVFPAVASIELQPLIETKFFFSSTLSRVSEYICSICGLAPQRQILIELIEHI